MKPTASTHKPRRHRKWNLKGSILIRRTTLLRWYGLLKDAGCDATCQWGCGQLLRILVALLEDKR